MSFELGQFPRDQSLQQLKDERKKAWENNRKTQEAVKQRIDPKRQIVKFEVGDQVALRNHKAKKGLSVKLQKIFNPGFTVAEKKSDLVYKVRHKGGREGVVNVQQMRKVPKIRDEFWIEDNAICSDLDSDPSEEEEGFEDLSDE